ncbi:hypothetical protein Nepgr_018163 [Nepenthes gracilis]|uniref:protein-serine/threonine phosphatase n=1 Tax=Nepenthes gracilis TaxID=150966 RepID=A0AAD3STL4_NEPGR|nr:hypothetical protein Nepgr_018163 [Nepenthes gracilis]
MFIQDHSLSTQPYCRFWQTDPAVGSPTSADYLTAIAPHHKPQLWNSPIHPSTPTPSRVGSQFPTDRLPAHPPSITGQRWGSEPERDFPVPFSMLEGAHGKGSITNASENENLEATESLKERKFRKLPRHLSIVEHSISSNNLIPEAQLELDVGIISTGPPADAETDFKPIFRSGSCSEIGPRSCMEDEYVCIDDLMGHLGASIATDLPSPGAFYGVFDGHGGTDAAVFVRENILKIIVEDSHFPVCVKNAIQSAFIRADHAFANADSVDSSSGTTALIVLMFGRTMLVANVGDCRAVLGKRGRAVELSRDHKPNCRSERLRIEKLGSVVYDGYLNGQLSVSRALGDWHMKGSKGASLCSLSAEPEIQEIALSEEDEFLILGCDGLWDVISSQHAVTISRRELMLHNDPERCSRVLVREALKLNACDNLTVIVVCFSPDPPPRTETLQSRHRKSISAEGLDLLHEVMESNA